MMKPKAYLKDGQALTEKELEAHGMKIDGREPLYGIEALRRVCHMMASEASVHFCNGIAVSFDYDKVIAKAIRGE